MPLNRRREPLHIYGVRGGGDNSFTFTVHGADVDRSPCKYAVAMLGLVAPLPEGLLRIFPIFLGGHLPLAMCR